MSEPAWMDEAFVVRIHDLVVASTGGATGIRDAGLLSSAVNRPQQHLAYSDTKPDVFELAAIYAEGIARNHAFVDGNKRTAFATAGIFLELNGHMLNVEKDNEQQTLFENIAQGGVTRQALADWYRQNTTPVGAALLHDQADPKVRDDRRGFYQDLKETMRIGKVASPATAAANESLAEDAQTSSKSPRERIVSPLSRPKPF